MHTSHSTPVLASDCPKKWIRGAEAHTDIAEDATATQVLCMAMYTTGWGKLFRLHGFILVSQSSGEAILPAHRILRRGGRVI